MDFDHAVEQIVLSVTQRGIGAKFTYDEVSQWLKATSGSDLMWAFDELSDRLIREHSICFELMQDYIITRVPGKRDIETVAKRNLNSLGNR